MSTEVNSSVRWQKSLSLDRQNIIIPSANYYNNTNYHAAARTLQYKKSNFSTNIITADLPSTLPPPPPKNQSFLHSTNNHNQNKANLIESRKIFFSAVVSGKFNSNGSDDGGLMVESQSNCHDQPSAKNNNRPPATTSKKISFKIKKSSSIYRKNSKHIVNNNDSNKVADLAMKFNEMINKTNDITDDGSNKQLLLLREDEEKFRKFVQRVNSQRGNLIITTDNNNCTNERVTKILRKTSVNRKPSVNRKTKPNSVNKTISGNNILRRTPISGDSNKLCAVKTKIGYLETPQNPVHQTLIKRPNSLQVMSSPASASLGVADTGNGTSSSVKAAIEIFERRSISETIITNVPKKPKVPEKTFTTPNNAGALTKTEEFAVQILNIPAVLPQRRCDSKYEETLLHLKKSDLSDGYDIGGTKTTCKPNTSFLWGRNQDRSPTITIPSSLIPPVDNDDWKSLYDVVDPKPMPPPKPTTKVYEQLQIVGGNQQGQDENNDDNNSGYEYCESTPVVQQDKYEDVTIARNNNDDDNDDYEECNTENIYECLPLPPPATTLPPLLPKRQQQDMLPPRPPPSRNNSYCTIENHEITSNCYESIYNERKSRLSDTNNDGDDDDAESNNYESIYGCHIRGVAPSDRDSIVSSSDQQSNSLYGRSSLIHWGGGGGSVGNDDDNVSNTYNYSSSGISKATSDLSSSDRSDEWIDVTDNEDNVVNRLHNHSGFIIVREKHKNKKNSGWSQHFREQWTKSPRKIPVDQGLDTDSSDHHYESLYTTSDNDNKTSECCQINDDDYDSFDSGTESESSFTNINSHKHNNFNDSGVDIANSQLPEPPTSGNQIYGFTRLAASAGKQMKKLRRNWSLTKNDITKSLSRMTRRKSRTNLVYEDVAATTTQSQREQEAEPAEIVVLTETTQSYQNLVFGSADQTDEKAKSLSRRGFLDKFRRSMSMSSESASELTKNLDNKGKSTFYLTGDINIDDNNDSAAITTCHDSGVSLSPPPQPSPPVAAAIKSTRTSTLIRPQSPPPPAPPLQNPDDSKKVAKKDKQRSTSWYAEVGLFNKNSESALNQQQNKNHQRPNTFWYAEVGLYQMASSPSLPSTSSSTENSGNNPSTNSILKSNDYINQDDHQEVDNNKDTNEEEYYNVKNYNESIHSLNSNETKKDDTNSVTTPDMQLLRLQDEPLYQFYDAAVLESVCSDGTTTSSDFDSDGYEEVGDKILITNNNRPSAMELVVGPLPSTPSPNRNSIIFARTLWCEIPEVIQSTVLSTLSQHQKKIQEAKFEMITSEASYLNSLNVLHEHFIVKLRDNYQEVITDEEIDLLFGQVNAVKSCSERLLFDLERCWQDNILLHGVCDIIQKHAEENFYVYVTYCENQILLDDTLKRFKEKPGFSDLIKQLESSAACHSLTLYSFLMLPMQRITRWPLLVDAVLKRLSPQDSEYASCQYTLATVNKIVSQCNEGARRKGRENELKKLARQLEFAKNVTPVDIAHENRWLIRSGVVVQMQPRTDETKLTFGKRFVKVPLHLFLFNDILFVAKSKSDNLFSIIHYCPRNLVELNSTDTLVSLPAKETQGRHLLFMTLLENQNEKTVEFLLACSSESDRERWMEALTPPKSEDPDETLYECWDCPQVTAMHNYVANQPDELALAKGDVINVLRKMADGWYHGERIRDGQVGWFPANYTVEIANPHVRSRNLKQRYRLLAFSENYLKTK